MTTRPPERLERLVAPPATVAIPSPEPRTAQEQAYLDAVLPLVERLVGEGRSLAELGQSRSRNVLELRTRSERFRDAADAVAATEGRLGVPGRLAAFSEELNLGIGAALASVEEAEAAFLRFDWDALGTSVASFSASVEAIAASVDTFDVPPSPEAAA